MPKVFIAMKLVGKCKGIISTEINLESSLCVGFSDSTSVTPVVSHYSYQFVTLSHMFRG